MSVVVRGTFAMLDDGSLAPVAPTDGPRPLSAASFRDDDDDCAGGAVEPSDFADFKTRAEVLLKGACHTPRGEAIGECAVQVKVADWSKTLRVIGRRVWGGSAAPAPFVTMPLDWEHAYGGPSYAKNPSGLGYDTDELPNVVRPEDVLRSRGASLEPATFGPVNPRWPQRAGKLGQDYGETYKKTRAPYFAADMDPTYFLASAATKPSRCRTFIRARRATRRSCRACSRARSIATPPACSSRCPSISTRCSWISTPAVSSCRGAASST
jgi:hypothetical protein